MSSFPPPRVQSHSSHKKVNEKSRETFLSRRPVQQSVPGLPGKLSLLSQITALVPPDFVCVLFRAFLVMATCSVFSAAHHSFFVMVSLFSTSSPLFHRVKWFSWWMLVIQRFVDWQIDRVPGFSLNPCSPPQTETQQAVAVQHGKSPGTFYCKELTSGFAKPTEGKCFAFYHKQLWSSGCWFICASHFLQKFGDIPTKTKQMTFFAVFHHSCDVSASLRKSMTTVCLTSI